ncbi:winged helix-turn-helix transcriptional regulator [Actinomadura barringtoniae]|uniref:Winged helix-turn-helix transcriptional regulator n=1 Tax=Actinomadura barringtoniae TaxID=1427535 RepID=A0A939TD45_9ACTN|nr:MarR family winged helix-turn-helix transcriptional regulator [Actinomadura barringtoniae]MBO2455212.1 winged helix-turn-helix transcriptional regulator [Actinomadura barringtoniae]
MDRPTEQIEYETMLLGRHSHLVAEPVERDDRLERSGYILLSRVRVDGPMTIRQLSDAFGLDPSTLNRQTSALMRAGLLERIPDPDGGIARKFRITAVGERRLDEHRDDIITGLDKVMAGWSGDDIAAFAGFLRRFNTDIEHLTGRPWPRP